MANGKKISEQRVADSLQGDELFPFAMNGGNSAVKADTIKDFVGNGLAQSSDIPQKVSELENDEKFQTEVDVDGKVSNAVESLQGKIDGKVDKVNGKALSSNDYTDADKSKLDGIAKDAQVNVLEGVKVNGVALSIADKIVSILIATGTANGTVKVQDVDVPVKGLAAMAYKANVSESDLATALKAVIDAKAENTDVTALSDKIDMLNGTGAGSVSKAINDAFNEFSTNVSNDGVVNSYKELIDWAAEHGADAAELTASIQRIDGLLSGIGGAGEPADVKAAIAKAISDLNIGNYYTKSQTDALLDKKVDKADGKDLSANDFTDALLTKLNGIEAGAQKNPTKVSQLANDSKYQTESQVKVVADTKVDKVTGKQLSTEDFTTALKQKLESLSNYDDTELTKQLAALKTRLDVLVGSGDVTAVIDTFQEIENFLAGITNKETLTGLLQDLKSDIMKLCADTYLPSASYTASDILDKLKTVDGINSGLDAELLGGQQWDCFATKEDLESLSNYMTGGSANPELFRNASNLCAVAFSADDLSPDAVDSYGQKDFVRCWEFYLVDVTAAENSDGTMTPIGKLKHNNLLRFADGRFAPTVGITEAMRAECDVALYLSTGGKNKWCDAGQFDPEAFYTAHGMAKLYNSSGQEVRVLRPWETTETKYSIFLGTDKTLYPIDDVIGDSGRRWRGVFDRMMKWDGIDFARYALAPTGISPAPICTVGNKARCFFFAYEPDHNYCKSDNGTGSVITVFRNGRTYPRINDVNQVSMMTYARGLNADTTAPYPFAEGGYHAYNVFNLCLESIHGTKNLNSATTFGNGISSTHSCSNETQWLANGGVRFRKSTDTVWSYNTFGATPDMLPTATGNKVTWSEWLNDMKPKEQCMESQMAYSFAVERGISEGEKFEFCGSEYWYYNAIDDDDRMNVRVYKIVGQNGCSAFSSDGSPVVFDVEACLRMSLYEGANLSGDIFAYMGGGLEIVGHSRDTEELTGFDVDLYLQPDQRKWVRETNVTCASGSSFSFENSYFHMGAIQNLGDSWIDRRLGYTPWKIKKGGSVSTGECAYAWDNAYWNDKVTGNKRRVGCRGRGYASYSSCSRRYLSAHYVASLSARSSSGLLQVLLDVSKMQ